MAHSLKSSWFGREVAVLLVNGKTLTGTVAEATDIYIVLQDGSGADTQVMVHAIVAIKPTSGKPAESP